MATRARRRGWGEAVWAAVAVLLLSPLVVFANAGTMPLWGLFAVAAGIAVALALVGRRLHDSFLSDVLGRRQSVGRWILVVAIMLAGLFVVLVGMVIALVWVASGGVRNIPF